MIPKASEREEVPVAVPGKIFRWAALIEALVLILVLEIINRLFYPELPGFKGVAPNPLWLVAILVPLRHGFREGLAIGALTAADMAFHLISNRAGGFHYSVITIFADFLEPFLIICVSTFIGDRIGVLRTKISDLSIDLELSRREADILQEKSRASQEALRLLDSRIITQMSSVLDLMKALSDTGNMTIEELVADLLSNIREYVGAWDVTFYRVTETGLVEAERQCVTEGHSQVQRVSPDEDPVLSEALRSGRMAYLSEFLREDDMDRALGMCLMARNISFQTDRSMGVIGVHGMGFIDYNPYNFKLFDTIVDLWSSAISRRMTFEELAGKSIFNEETGAYNPHYFHARFKGEFDRALQYSFPLSLALLEIGDYTDTRIDVRKDLITVIARIITAEVTELDLVAKHEVPARFAIIFPGLLSDETRLKMERVAQEIGAFGFAPYNDQERMLSLRWGVADYSIGMNDPSEMISRAEENMEGSSLG